jgi:hypothetical protein
MLIRSTAFGLVALVAMPASAAQFFIVQDTEKQSCTITQTAPTDERFISVGDGAYDDEATAASDMRKMLACNPRDVGTGAAQNPTPAPAKQ